MIREIDSSDNFRRIDDETKALMEESRRRLREHEGIPEYVVGKGFKMADGSFAQGVKGKARLPSLDTVTGGFGGEPTITTYTPTAADMAGLEKELRDLDRDAELMAKHDTVEYADVLNPWKVCFKCGVPVKILESRFAEHPMCPDCVKKYPLRAGVPKSE